MDKIANGFTVRFASRFQEMSRTRERMKFPRDGRKERDRNSKNERLLASSDHRHRRGSILSRLTSHKLSNLQHNEPILEFFSVLQLFLLLSFFFEREKFII